MAGLVIRAGRRGKRARCTLEVVRTGRGHWDWESIRVQRIDLAEHQSQVSARYQQWFIDTEVRDSRHALLRLARERTSVPTLGFLDADFLQVADAPTVHRAVIDAAVEVTGAAAADLQVYDRVGEDLRIVEQRGLSQDFLRFFTTVDRSTPSACAAAWRTGMPVIVDRVATTPSSPGSRRSTR